MRNVDPANSPLEAAAGAAGPRAIEAFKRLGNETRLAILLALWEAYEPFDDDDAVPFSTLYERVGIGDSGNFSYHLEKLTGHFVRRTEEGYELRNAGRKLVRAVIAGTGLDEASFDPTEIDKPCPHCGAPVAVAYRDEWLFQVCTECEGTFAGSDEFLPGTLTVWPFDQAGLSDRTPEEMFVAGGVATVERYAMMIGGICPECSGAVDTSLDVCHDHEPPTGGMCSACDRRYPVQVRFVCGVCKNKMWGPPSILVAVHPRVVAFYASRGVELGTVSADLTGVTDLMRLVREHDRAESVSADPPTVEVTFRCAGDELRLLVDDDLEVLDIEVRT